MRLSCGMWGGYWRGLPDHYLHPPFVVLSSSSSSSHTHPILTLILFSFLHIHTYIISRSHDVKTLYHMGGLRVFPYTLFV